MNSRMQRPRARRLAAALVGLALAGSTLSVALADVDVAAAATPVTAPAADLLDVDFTGVDASGNPVDHSPAARVATRIGTPTYATDATLARSVPSFNADVGAGSAAVPAGTDADGYTYSIADAYAAGTIQDGFTYECVFRVDAQTAAENEICGDKFSGGFGMYVSAGTMTLRASVYDGAYQTAPGTLRANTWYDAVQVWDGSAIKLYLNGEFAGMTSGVGAMVLPAATRRVFTFAGSPASATTLNFRGQATMAAGRMWSTPLGESDVAKVFKASGVPALGTGGAGEVTVPKADVLDVDLLHGDVTDHANGSAPHVFGAPVKTFDTSLHHVVATFNGTNDALSYDFSDYWNLGHTPNVTNAFTIECYLKVNRQGTALQKTCSGEQTGGFSIAVPANTTAKVQAEAYIAGGYKAISAAITPDAWNHVVLTYNGSAEKLYVNGALKAGATVSGRVSPPGGTGFDIGADTGASWPTAESWSSASVAIARVWSSALTEDQVAKLFLQDTSTSTAPKADVLDVDFHDSSYGDASPNHLVPEEYGTPQIVTDPALRRPVAAFAGDGSAQVYDLTPFWDATHSPNIVTGFSIQCDFRYDGTLPAASEMNVCSGKETGGYSVNVSGSSIRMRACVGDGGSSCPYLTAPIRSGVWYSMVATYDSATGDYRLYLDGVLVSGGTLNGTGDDPQASPMGWALGADINGSGQPQTPAPVTIAQARIWGSALTAQQVGALYAQDFGSATTDIALTSSQPAAGERITKAQELKVVIRNKEQATGWTYDIDGRTVQPGSTIGAGFASGDHVLTITATDSFGVPVRFAVPFTSANIPGTSATDTGQGKGTVTLSAAATAPTGGEVTTTFRAATPSVADGGETGAIPAIPATLDFSSTATRTLSGAQDFDGTSAASVSEHDLLPYQRFDVAVPAGDARHVRWSGTVDPQRAVTLYAWDTVDTRWQQIAAARGTAGAQTALDGEVADSMVDAAVTVAPPGVGAVHLLVVVTDPFYDDLSARDGSNDDEEFQDPSTYDFSFVHWTDPQYVAEGAAGGSGYYPASPVYQTAKGDNALRSSKDEQKVWAAAYEDAAQWTVDNAERRKIAYASNTGDIINNNVVDPASPANLAKYGPAAAGDSNRSGQPYSEQKDQIDRENAFARSAFEKIWHWKGADGNGLVSQVVAGNHDNRNGTDAKTSPTDPTNPAAQSTTADDFYNGTFAAGDYYAQARSWPAGASYHAIDEVTDADGRVVTPGTDNQDSYVLFSAGGQDFVVVGLSYGVTPAEAQWASDVFSRYHDRNGILITHGYLSASSNADGRTAGKSSDGSRLFTKVVTANPNVFLVLAGHVHGVGTNLLQVKDKTASVTHKTVELLADYQEYQMPASKIFTGDHCEAAGLDPASKCRTLPNGDIDVDGDGAADHHPTDSLRFGASFLRLLQFDTEKSTMTVESYSPFFDEYGAAEYDSPSKRYNGSEDAFTVPVDLMSRTTSFSTDGIAVLTPSDQVIGSATARSGLAASVTWSGLVEGRTYAWTATSVDADGADAGTADQFGGIFTATRAGTDATAPVLTGLGDRTITVGDAFDPKAGVTASDAADGDVTAGITVVGTVDTSRPGTYPLLYTAADGNGNTTQGQRVVTVRAAAAPVKTPTSVTASNQTVTFGEDATLTARISPADVSGTVVFNNGEDPICEAPVVRGTATCVTRNFGGVGGQSYVADATFYPDAVDAYEMSERAFVLTIAPAPAPPVVRRHAGAPVLRVAKAPTSQRGGKATLTVAPAVDGVVTVTLVKGKRHRTLTVGLTAGRATVRLPRLVKGVWRVSLTYHGSSRFLGSSSSTRLKVRR